MAVQIGSEIAKFSTKTDFLGQTTGISIKLSGDF
jgi:hypothetical protein